MTDKVRVIVTDDETAIAAGLAEILRDLDYEVDTAASGAEALERLEAESFDLLITDLKMPKMDGITLLRKARERDPELVAIVITAHASWETAVEAMKAGAFDYLAKPFKIAQVRLVVERAAERRGLAKENQALKEELRRQGAFVEIVGISDAMEKVKALIAKVAATPSTVLITGETGTGKELVARAIHRLSNRRDGPFIPVNCGAIPETLLESELFGYGKGAFTGANADKSGLFEAANGGTFFLDEVASIPHAMQVKILRVLQEGEVQRVGEAQPRKVDVRIVAATNRDLKGEVDAGNIREDFFYRLNVINIGIPPLRERPGDVRALAESFLENLSREIGRSFHGFSDDAMRRLETYEWPGNVRQLRNAVEHAVIVGTPPDIELEDLPSEFHGDETSTPSAPLGDPGLISLAELEKQQIIRVLEATGFHQAKAAEILGINRRTLYRKIRELGLKSPE
ncbi:MAG: sigma-54 dependent transcriptional regulator [Planctomycetota bacterium]